MRSPYSGSKADNSTESSGMPGSVKSKRGDSVSRGPAMKPQTATHCRTVSQRSAVKLRHHPLPLVTLVLLLVQPAAWHVAAQETASGGAAPGVISPGGAAGGGGTLTPGDGNGAAAGDSGTVTPGGGAGAVNPVGSGGGGGSAASELPSPTEPTSSTSSRGQPQVQLLPTLPLQTAETSNATGRPASGAAANRPQQQQPGGAQAAPIPAGDRSSSGGDAGNVVPNPETSKTDSAMQQAQQQVQGPAADSTQQTTDGAMPLVNFPGCSRGGSSFLPPGLFQGCEVQGLLSRRDADAFIINVAQTTNATRPHRLLLVLRTVDGDAQLGLSVPQNGVTDPIPDQVGTRIYSTEITSEVVIEVPWGVLSQNPGRYLVTITQARRRVLYTLRVTTPYDDVLLAEPDLSVMADFHKDCCEAGNATSSFCTEYLPAAIAPNHSPDADMCRMTPMMCDEEGHLTQLVVARAGLICPSGLPASFPELAYLETLDLAFNDINMDITDVGKMVSQLSLLKNAFLRYTSLFGPLSADCELISTANLTRLSLSGNNITGPLPDCFMMDPTLEELYLSQTGLRGPIPDVLPAESPLRLLFAINFIQPDRVGFTGPLPGSLFAAPALMYVDLSNHKFSGGLPAISSNIKLLNLSNNALDGEISGPFPASIESIDLAFNNLKGNLPAGIDQLVNLTMFNVQDNELSGPLPQALPDSLLVFDASENQLTGSPPAQLPAAMHYFNAAENQLSGELPALPHPSLLLTYIVHSNSGLKGTLPASLINGSAPALVFADLHGCELTGRLDGSAKASGGRKMLQDTEGAAWANEALAYLDLSNNSFTGPVPASLGNLTDLRILDLSDNQLSGSLEPFADQLANSATDTERPDLIWLNVSSNQLTGEVPDSLQFAPIFDPSRVGTVGFRGQLPPRILDLSENSMSGDFPTWAATQPALVSRACGQRCEVDVRFNGTNMKLNCPADVTLTPEQIAFLENQDLQCTDGSGNKVSLLSVVGTGAADPAGTHNTTEREPSSTTQQASAAELNNLDSPLYGAKRNTATGYPHKQQQQLGPGPIAGIVIGSLAGAAILVAILVLGIRRCRHNRAGWRKDDFGHNAAMGDAFGVAGLPPPRHTAGNGIGTGFGSIGSVGGMKSVRFQDNVMSNSAETEFKSATNGASGEYPHTPYEHAQAGIEMLNTRRNHV